MGRRVARAATAMLAVALALGAAGSATAVPQTLDFNSAEAVGNAFASDCGACEAGVTECERLSTRRIDCVAAESGSCLDVVSTRLGTRGYLFYDIYDCKSPTPTTAAAQVQANPPGGLQYEPLTPAPFEFKDVYPKNLPYPAFPVRHYSGPTSQRFERADLWLRPNLQLLDGSGIEISASCFHGFQFVALGGARLSHHGTELSAGLAHAAKGRPAFKLHARVVAHHTRIGGAFRLLHLRCAKKPITFSAQLVGRPGF